LHEIEKLQGDVVVLAGEVVVVALVGVVVGAGRRLRRRRWLPVLRRRTDPTHRRRSSAERETKRIEFVKPKLFILLKQSCELFKKQRKL
jgi:hypothetical protein